MSWLVGRDIGSDDWWWLLWGWVIGGAMTDCSSVIIVVVVRVVKYGSKFGDFRKECSNVSRSLGGRMVDLGLVGCRSLLGILLGTTGRHDGRYESLNEMSGSQAVV